MLRDIMALTEQERVFKRIYMGEGREILSTPMEYGAYRKMLEKHPDFPDLGTFYEESTKDCLGSTILDLKGMMHDEVITVVLHERYGYPIWHNHSFVEIAYVYSGTCTHYVEEQCFSMEKGDLCILAPNATHVITALQDDAIIINILLSKEVLNRSFLQMVKEKHLLAEFFENVLYRKRVSPYIIFPTGEDARLGQIILEMYRETREKQYAYRESLSLAIRRMFIHVLRYYEMSARVSAPLEKNTRDPVVALLGYLSLHYNQTTLKEAAAYFNYNEAYLSRMMKKYTGKTFGTLAAELQMKHAKELLGNPEMSLSDIAQEVGCYDCSHFCRKFKKVYGVSPDTYRNGRGG